MIEAATVNWLRFDLDRLPQKEVLEYSIKKPLVAASCILTLEKNASGEILNVEGAIALKIPFKGNHSFQSTSVSKRSDGPVGFSIFKEWQDDKPLRMWLNQGGRLKLVRDGEMQPRREFEVVEDVTLPATLLNSLTLLSVLSSWLPSPERVFAAQFVVTDKIFALRLEMQDNGEDFKVFVKDIAAPLSDEEWLAIVWPTTAMVEGTWSLAAKAVTSLRVRVPVLGSLELPLVRSSRE